MARYAIIGSVVSVLEPERSIREVLELVSAASSTRSRIRIASDPNNIRATRITYSFIYK
jgi:hypothetical protein